MNKDYARVCINDQRTVQTTRYTFDVIEGSPWRSVCVPTGLM